MTDVSDRTTHVRSGRFSFLEPALFCSRLYLYEDRIELRGWRWFGRYRREIPFRRLLRADVSDEALVLWLSEGSALRLQVDEPTGWKRAINARLDDRTRWDAPE